MSMNEDVREVQVGLHVLGFPPGELDGWWGPKTAAAAGALLERPWDRVSSPWALQQLQTGLRDLGWTPGAVDGIWGPKTAGALGALGRAGGRPRALTIGAVAAPQLPPKAPLQVISQGAKLTRGSVVVDTAYIHTTATSGRFLEGKTNGQMFDAIRHFHTAPVSAGGRGWSDTAYNALCCPDGEVIPGRPVERVPAGVLHHNERSVHISLFPLRTIERMHDRPLELYSQAQLDGVRRWLEEMAGITPITRLRGHNEDAAKLCPGVVVIDRDWTELAVA